MRCVPRFLLIAISLTFLTPASRAADNDPHGRAVDFHETTIYHPPEKPGFAAWVQLWRSTGDGALMCKFIERRTPKTPPATQPAIDVHRWETLGLPGIYNFDPLVTETVFMKSADEGATWKEVSRGQEKELNRGPDSGCFSPVSLPDGRLLSVSWGMPGCLRESRDSGKSWRVLHELMDPRYFDVFPFSMRLLSDGKTLVIFCPYGHAWGPGTDYPTRLSGDPGAKGMYTAALLWSDDFGQTLHGPIPIYPGVPVTETDFCELPNGDLLFMHAKLFGGTCHRQLVRHTREGLVPDRMEACGSDTPEIFLRTKEGYLVGASRNGAYVWSDDDGTSWFPLEGAPACGYQPRAIALKDGRLMFAWHKGGDLGYKQADEWIGEHTFRVHVDRPRQRTKLRLARVYDPAQRRYDCAFDATLTNGEGKPVAGQPVEFSIVARDAPGYEPFGGATPWVHGAKQIVKTDERGVARVEYPEQRKVTFVHQSYQICARFNADHAAAGFVPSTSVVMEYYAVTPKARSN